MCYRKMSPSSGGLKRVRTAFIQTRLHFDIPKPLLLSRKSLSRKRLIVYEGQLLDYYVLWPQKKRSKSVDVSLGHKERKLLYFETQDHLYSIESYYLAKIASDLPFHAWFIVLYVIPVYFMTSMPLDLPTFLQVFVIVFMSVLCSRGLAMMSAALMPTFQSSCFFAQCIFSLFIMSAGFFINLDNILTEFKWVSVISYLRWGFEGLCLTEIAPLNFTCKDELVPGTCVRDGEVALRMYAFGDETIWHAMTALCSTLVVFFGLMYMALKLVPQQPEEHV